MVEVRVLRRWRGSPVQPNEKCGVPAELAKELAAMDPPCVEILRGGKDVPETAGISAEGAKEIQAGRSGADFIGADALANTTPQALFGLIESLVRELQAERKGRKN